MNGRSGLQLELKKGDPENLMGKLVAYVEVELDPSESSNPMASMIQNGILAVKANYVDQRTIKDFFQAEFGVSLEKGIQEVIDQAKMSGGLEGALDPEAVREKLESMKNAEFIPIPAKVAHYENAEEILSEDADVYFLGKFQSASHAHLCVNSFPIMYQAYFREQEHQNLEKEIKVMLEAIESPPEKKDNPDQPTIMNFEGNLKSYLLKELIPEMIYSSNNTNEYKEALDRFEYFMSDFGHPDDVNAIIKLVESDLQSNPSELKKLELLVSKIEALQNEDYEKLEKIKKELNSF